MSICRDCKAAIIWAEHAGTGRRAPINAEPEEGGNILLLGAGYIIITAEQAEAYKGGDAHISHFATCPAAAERRRPR